MPPRTAGITRCVLSLSAILAAPSAGATETPEPSPQWRGALDEEGIHELTVFEPRLFAFHKTTGELLADIELPRNVMGAPMTYFAGGK